tara:strand:+ start:117 stop:377 length:261 start_codon:yes stop_codon:yes gene_type:complete
MDYASTNERQFIDDAIVNGTYKIDHSYKSVSRYDNRNKGFNFLALGVTSRNSDRFILRALYRYEQKREENRQLAEWAKERNELAGY